MRTCLNVRFAEPSLITAQILLLCAGIMEAMFIWGAAWIAAAGIRSRASTA